MPQHHSEDYKISAVKYFLIGVKTQENVCKIFKCSVRSLLRWVDKYKKDGVIKRYNRKPIAYKVKKEHVSFLLNEIKNNKTITMDDLLKKLKDKFKNISITRIHLMNVIKDNYITLKRAKIRHEPIERFGKPININEQLKIFYDKVKQYNINNIICIDETSISAFQHRYYCYNEIGKRCVIKTKKQDVFKKYTAIFAISTKGVIGWKLYEKGGIDSERLINFLNENIVNKYNNNLIILDNASCHRNNDIKNLINKNNKLLHSIPYQHFTNSIEMFFSVMKSKLQKLEGVKFNELHKNIENVINDIPNEMYKNIFNGAYNRNEPYIIKQKLRKYKNYK